MITQLVMYRLTSSVIAQFEGVQPKGCSAAGHKCLLRKLVAYLKTGLFLMSPSQDA